MERSAYGTLLDAVRTLTWPAQRRGPGQRTGSHRSSLRGRAPELTEYRRYRQGDDPRDLDWKLLARSDRAFVRLSEDRSILETWLLLDASASMAFPAPGNDKWRCACGMAVGLASIAQRAGDPIGVKVSTGGEVAPTTRRDVVTAIETALSVVRPAGRGPMAPLLDGLSRASRLVLLSDFLGDEAAMQRVTQAHLAAGGEVCAVHILSRSERSLGAVDGMVRDPEAPELLRPVDARARATYQQQLDAWLERCAAEWSAVGARYTRVLAEDDPAEAIRRVVGAGR